MHKTLINLWLYEQNFMLYLLKFFLLNVQHGLDPPHHLPK